MAPVAASTPSVDAEASASDPELRETHDTASHGNPRSEPSLCDWLGRLASAKISARELAERCLTRIDAANPQLNAVIAREPELTLAEADRADRRRREGSQAPLLGLPLTIKDVLDVRGFTCTGGSYARQGFRPQHDATAVARLRHAGAVILGKTNAPELSSSYETHNAMHGRTDHPLDRNRTPGGSSGGEAAIISADASPAGLGTDGGGSIRVPCHYCGIVGLRGTTGRVPETGNWPGTRASGLGDIVCVGPIARFVEDLELLLEVIAGPDWVDPYAVPVPLRDSAAVDRSSLRVGAYVDDGVARPTSGTRTAVEAAVAALANAGCRVEETEPPDLSDATELFFAAAGADGGEGFRRISEAAGGRHHEQFAEFIGSVSEHPPSAAEHFEIQRRLFEFRAVVRAFLSRHDVVICPVAAGPAPLHDRPPGDHPADQYLAYEGFNYTHTYAVAGLPVVVVPASHEEGLPVGVQLVAQPWREDVALAAAGILERELGGYPGITVPLLHQRGDPSRPGRSGPDQTRP